MARKARLAPTVAPLPDVVLVKDGVVTQLWCGTRLASIPSPDTYDGELREIGAGLAWPGMRLSPGGVATPPRRSVEQLRRRAIEDLAGMIAERQAAVLAGAGAEAATWPAKRREAEALLGGDGSAGDLLAIESELTGEPIETLARKVRDNGETADREIVRLTGIRRSHKKRLETAKAEELDGILAEAAAAAATAD